MERDELASWLRLTLTPGIGNTAARKLLSAFGLPMEVFAQPAATLRQVVTDVQASALLEAPAELAAGVERTVKWLGSKGPQGETHRILALGDPAYPASLLEMADPPLVLYLIGPERFELAQLARSIAMVGSRNPTAQGSSNARAFARAFGEASIAVVSGLALGIDGAAHEGALDTATDAMRPATVAVVGTGLDRVYPARHHALAQRIAAQGLIVSEFPLGTPPLNQNFPKRNRIIAGLSRGTLVVEAALQSGSLITARLASEQGKEVFAIPGSIHSPQSRGCHALIRQGAKLVETVNDVLEELRFYGSPTPATPPLLEEEESTAAGAGLLRAMGYDPASLDTLCARTGLPAAALQAQLLEQELAGYVARLPGGLFQRVMQG
ncbi:DNA protecting protein DprA [Variovorax sp. PBS-H4]|uniref:DNA-processing protein DprA n=1 Tax=Variovorax sp. PBS-H4 TaxID=434008 RepID=UPI00131870EE|nr:DNA-processing protein DprA [Variovorax sp. PBS-H4]VTU41035.1 DNA protecting protein DprA [Variovorax sp. PBS-H4]